MFKSTVIQTKELSNTEKVRPGQNHRLKTVLNFLEGSHSNTSLQCCPESQTFCPTIFTIKVQQLLSAERAAFAVPAAACKYYEFWSFFTGNCKNPQCSYRTVKCKVRSQSISMYLCGTGALTCKTVASFPQKMGLAAETAAARIYSTCQILLC